MPVYQIGGKAPVVAENVFVADTATIVGDVSIAEKCSVWFGAVVRGDNAAIRIGEGSNVQDCAVLHGSPCNALTVGKEVTVGHGAKLHGCTIGDRVLIGISAVVLDHVVVGSDSLVAAGAVLTSGKVYPPRSLIVGQPAVVKRELTDQEVARVLDNAVRYMRDARAYLEGLEPS